MSANINSNYGGTQPNNTAYLKFFVPGTPNDLWTIQNHKYNGKIEQVLVPSGTKYDNVYIPGDLFVDGNIVSPSDINLKDNIVEISNELSDNIMSLKPTQFTFKSDKSVQKQIHYGFIAQEFETIFPELVCLKPGKIANIKAINYLEILPLLVSKIQKMQNEIDELKTQIVKTNEEKNNKE